MLDVDDMWGQICGHDRICLLCIHAYVPNLSTRQVWSKEIQIQRQRQNTNILVYVPIHSGNQVWSVGILSLLKSINGSAPLSPIILSAIVSLWCYVDNFYMLRQICLYIVFGPRPPLQMTCNWCQDQKWDISLEKTEGIVSKHQSL